MRYLILLITILGLSSSLQAQIAVTDTITGGSYTLDLPGDVKDMIDKTTATKCYRPPTTNTPIRSEPETPENFDPCAQNNKVNGFKIQVMYTKDRNAANRSRAEFAAAFPDLVPTLEYSQPDYRVMGGDYFTKRSAAADLARVKRKYPGAFLVQWRVYCRRAK
ncbi:MAG: SPOR domain-containing protein [Weeksellaceae bacterium]|nr:SPOR domain-containing protein [Weeksellaceae bacterium]